MTHQLGRRFFFFCYVSGTSFAAGVCIFAVPKSSDVTTVVPVPKDPPRRVHNTAVCNQWLECEEISLMLQKNSQQFSDIPLMSDGFEVPEIIENFNDPNDREKLPTERHVSVIGYAPLPVMRCISSDTLFSLTIPVD
jgi:hypothetical protein